MHSATWNVVATQVGRNCILMPSGEYRELWNSMWRRLQFTPKTKESIQMYAATRGLIANTRCTYPTKTL